MASSYFLATKKWQKRLEEWESIQYHCKKCGLSYFEKDNIGKWQCKQHVLPFNENEVGMFHGAYQWDCCGYRIKQGKPLKANGCVRSDHTQLMSHYTEQDDIYIDKALITLILPGKESIVDVYSARETKFIRKDYEPGDYIARRYDWKNADSRQETGQSLYDPVNK